MNSKSSTPFKIVEHSINGNYFMDCHLSGGLNQGDTAKLIIAGEIKLLKDLNVVVGEDHIQTCYMDYLRLVAIPEFPACKWIHHVPNGGKRTPREGARMRRLGVKKGVADIFWPYKGVHGQNGLYIEFKVEGFHQSEEQVDFQLYCDSQGYEYKIAYSPMDAIRYTREYAGI